MIMDLFVLLRSTLRHIFVEVESMKSEIRLLSHFLDYFASIEDSGKESTFVTRFLQIENSIFVFGEVKR